MKMRTAVPASVASLVLCAGLARAQSFGEGFESGALPGTWSVSNQSGAPGTLSWRVGATTETGDALFGPHSGSFLAFVDYNSGTGATTLSNWLVLPQVTLRNGDSFSFWTRSTDGFYPDRMQVCMSTAGASTNTGAGATDMGDFSTVLLDINPNYTGTDYPLTYTAFALNISGLGAATPGRFAFRYFVENGGPAGNRSDCVGIDDVAYVSSTDAVGACCMPDGTCNSSVAGVCAGLGGTFRGVGVTCAAANCPSGACCLTNLTCATSTSAPCAAQGGTYGGDGSTCATFQCPFGACCIGATLSCTVLAASDCAAQGGTYQGNGSVCGTVPCAFGACCLGCAGCVTATPASCTAQGGTYHGDGSTCGTAGCNIVNGGFETSDFTGWSQFGDTGFTAVNAGLFTTVAPHGGTYEAHFGPTGGTGGIMQTIPAHAGDHVVIDFWYAVDAGSNPNNSFSADFDGANLYNITNDTTHDWQEFTFPVTVSANNPTLSFTFANPPLYGFLDDVTVCITPSNTSTCYANCDHSTAVPFLNISDFTCFLQHFANGNPANPADPANCDHSTVPPVLNISDFTCFLQKFAAGCSAP